ncbi:MAG: MTH1187 family thiamine-binding protein [Candidatus Hodarchaeota archaeon]
MSIKVIAEITTYPVGEGTSLSKFVKEAVKEIDEYPNIRVVHHPMGTVIEADNIDTVLEVTRRAHNAIANTGALRIITQLKIDDRRDKPRKMEDKVAAVSDD